MNTQQARPSSAQDIPEHADANSTVPPALSDERPAQGSARLNTTAHVDSEPPLHSRDLIAANSPSVPNPHVTAARAQHYAHAAGGSRMMGCQSWHPQPAIPLSARGEISNTTMETFLSRARSDSDGSQTSSDASSFAAFGSVASRSWGLGYRLAPAGLPQSPTDTGFPSHGWVHRQGYPLGDESCERFFQFYENHRDGSGHVGDQGHIDIVRGFEENRARRRVFIEQAHPQPQSITASIVPAGRSSPQSSASAPRNAAGSPESFVGLPRDGRDLQDLEPGEAGDALSPLLPHFPHHPPTASPVFAANEAWHDVLTEKHHGQDAGLGESTYYDPDGDAHSPSFDLAHYNGIPYNQRNVVNQLANAHLVPPSGDVQPSPLEKDSSLHGEGHPQDLPPPSQHTPFPYPQYTPLPYPQYTPFPYPLYTPFPYPHRAPFPYLQHAPFPYLQHTPFPHSQHTPFPHSQNSASGSTSQIAAPPATHHQNPFESLSSTDVFCNYLVGQYLDGELDKDATLRKICQTLETSPKASTSYVVRELDRYIEAMGFSPRPSPPPTLGVNPAAPTGASHLAFRSPSANENIATPVGHCPQSPDSGLSSPSPADHPAPLVEDVHVNNTADDSAQAQDTVHSAQESHPSDAVPPRWTQRPTSLGQPKRDKLEVALRQFHSQEGRIVPVKGDCIPSLRLIIPSPNSPDVRGRSIRTCHVLECSNCDHWPHGVQVCFFPQITFSNTIGIDNSSRMDISSYLTTQQGGDISRIVNTVERIVMQPDDGVLNNHTAHDSHDSSGVEVAGQDGQGQTEERQEEDGVGAIDPAGGVVGAEGSHTGSVGGLRREEIGAGGEQTGEKSGGQDRVVV